MGDDTAYAGAVRAVEQAATALGHRDHLLAEPAGRVRSPAPQGGPGPAGGLGLPAGRHPGQDVRRLDDSARRPGAAGRPARLHHPALPRSTACPTGAFRGSAAGADPRRLRLPGRAGPGHPEDRAAHLERFIAPAPEQWYIFKPIWPATAEEAAELEPRATTRCWPGAPEVGRGRSAAARTAARVWPTRGRLHPGRPKAPPSGDEATGRSPAASTDRLTAAVGGRGHGADPSPAGAPLWLAHRQRWPGCIGYALGGARRDQARRNLRRVVRVDGRARRRCGELPARGHGSASARGPRPLGLPPQRPLLPRAGAGAALQRRLSASRACQRHSGRDGRGRWPSAGR